jgi:hypothetical protein
MLGRNFVVEVLLSKLRVHDPQATEILELAVETRVLEGQDTGRDQAQTGHNSDKSKLKRS